MSQKLKKIKCNLTGKVLQIYNDYYEKKVNQYGSEENLIKFYIQNKIITLIKAGHSIESIANLLKFSVDKNKLDYYNELFDFHNKKSITNVIESKTSNFIETDSDLKKFINNWIEYNSKNG